MLYDNILGTIGRTPIVKINRLAPAGTTMYVKCEFFNPLSSVKDRLAIAIIEDAERNGTLKPGQTVVEATSGNTGIALAMVCAAKGYPFVAVMVETFSIERRKIMRMLGAKVILTPAAGRGQALVAKTAGSSRGNSKTRRTRRITATPPARKSSRISSTGVSTISSPAGVRAVRSPARDR
jgi:cysteine synthase